MTTPDDKRGNRLALAAIGATALLNIVVALRLPLLVGQWEDDGIYLVTAKALATGRGYRHLHLPGQPWQTKYPPLYPLVLAPFWCVFPHFPENVRIMQALNGVLAGAAGVAAYALLRRACGLSAGMAGAAVALGMLNPLWSHMIWTTMAEPLYTLLALTALLIVVQAGDAGAEARQQKLPLRAAVAGGLLAGAACLTRSIGVAVVAAVVLGWLARRCWRHAALAAVVSLAAVSLWLGWQRAASARNAAIPAAQPLQYDLDYRAWWPRELGLLSWVAYQNSSALAYALLIAVTDLPDEWFLQRLARGWPACLSVYISVAFGVIVCAVGLLALCLRHAATGLYVLFSLGLILIWPFPTPVRFLVPLLPLIMAGLLVGVGRIVGLLTARLRWGPKVGGVAITLAAVALLARYGVQQIAAFGPQMREYVRQRQELAGLISRQTPAKAVVAGNNGAYFHLVTERRFVPLVPGGDPLAFGYPRDRRWLYGGYGITPGGLRAYARMLDTQLLEYYRAAGVTHVVVLAWPEEGPAGLFGRYAEAHAATLRFLSQSGPYRLYAVNLTGG